MAPSTFIPTEMLCPDCGGDGEYPVSKPDYFDSYLQCWFSDEHWQRCEVCNGEGWVERYDDEAA